MGSSSSKQKVESNTAARGAKEDVPSATRPQPSDYQNSPSTDLSSSRISAESDSLPNIRTKSPQATGSKESAQAIATYPDLSHAGQAPRVSSAKQDKNDSESLDVTKSEPQVADQGLSNGPWSAADAATTLERGSRSRKSTSPLSQKRSPPAPVVLIPNTVESLVVSLRSRNHEREADALEALQKQAEKDAGSATLLDAILSGKSLDDRMGRDWQRYIKEVEVAGSATTRKHDLEGAEPQESSHIGKRKRSIEEVNNKAKTAGKSKKKIKVDDRENVSDKEVQAEDLDSSRDEQEGELNQSEEGLQASGQSQEEKQSRRSKKGKRGSAQSPKADRPVHLVIDVGDNPVVLKRRRHKGKRGLGKRKKAILERRRSHQAQEEETAA